MEKSQIWSCWRFRTLAKLGELLATFLTDMASSEQSGAATNAADRSELSWLCGNTTYSPHPSPACDDAFSAHPRASLPLFSVFCSVLLACLQVNGALFLVFGDSAASLGCGY